MKPLNKKEAGKIIYIAVSVIIIALILAYLLIGDSYTYLCEDDFSFETGVRDAYLTHGNSSFKGAILSTIPYCKMWQGTYLSVFLYFFIGPYYRWGISGYHFFVMLFSLILCFSLYLVISAFTGKKNLPATLGLFAAALLGVFQMRGTFNNQEIIFWYTGAVNYTLFLSLSLITLGLEIKLLKDQNIKFRKLLFGLTVFLAFCSSLGCLEVTAFNCSCMLAVIILNITDIKNRRFIIYPFCAAFLAAILNVLSPGNFSKSDMWVSDSHSSFLNALYDSLKCHATEARFILLDPVFLIVLILVFFTGYYFKVQILDKKPDVITMLIIIGGVYLIQFFTLFPVIFGYHSTELSSERTKATYEIVARITIIFVVLVLAQFVRELQIAEKTRMISCIVLLIAVLIPALINIRYVTESIKDGMICRIADDLSDKSLQNNYYARMYVITAMEMADKDEDVRLSLPLSAVNTRSMYGMGITDDPGWLVNISAADLCNVNSVAIEYY